MRLIDVLKAQPDKPWLWDWISKKDSKKFDIEIGNKFRARWNLETYNDAWLINKNSINEVGCIHTAQGLEVDYIGVIVGLDLIFENNKLKTNKIKRIILLCTNHQSPDIIIPESSIIESFNKIFKTDTKIMNQLKQFIK